MSRRNGIRLTEALDWRVCETSRPGLSYGGHRGRGGPPSAPPNAPVLERAGSHTRTPRQRCPCLFQSRCGPGREAFWSPSRRPRAPREQRTSQRPLPVLSPLPTCRRISRRPTWIRPTSASWTLPSRDSRRCASLPTCPVFRPTPTWIPPTTVSWTPPSRDSRRSASLASHNLILRGRPRRRRRPASSRPAHRLSHDVSAERNVDAIGTPGAEDGSLGPFWSSSEAVAGSQPLPVSEVCIGCLRSSCLAARRTTSPTRASSTPSAHF